jgi:hypothetical protein
MPTGVLDIQTSTLEKQEMLNIHAIKKDTLHAVMLQQMYSLNYVWLRYEEFIQQKAPELYGGKQYYQLFQDYGSEEARRLIKTLGFPTEKIKDLIRFLQYSHWAILENIEIAEPTANSFRMRTLDCSAQRAAKRGLRIRRGFFKGINPKAKVERIFTPPEAGPEGRPSAASCEWLVSLK